MKYRYQAVAILLLAIVIGTGVAFAQTPGDQNSGLKKKQDPVCSRGRKWVCVHPGCNREA